MAKKKQTNGEDDSSKEIIRGKKDARKQRETVRFLPNHLGNLMDITLMHGQYTTIDSKNAFPLFDRVEMLFNAKERTVECFSANSTRSAFSRAMFTGIDVQRDASCCMVDIDVALKLYKRAWRFAKRSNNVLITIDDDGIQFKAGNKFSRMKLKHLSRMPEEVKTLKTVLAGTPVEYDEIEIENRIVRYAKKISFDKTNTTCIVVIDSGEFKDALDDIDVIDANSFKFSIEKDEESGSAVFVVKIEDQLKNDLFYTRIHTLLAVGTPPECEFGSGMIPVISNLDGFVTLNFVEDFLFFYNERRAIVDAEEKFTPLGYSVFGAITSKAEEDDVDEYGIDADGIDMDALESEFESGDDNVEMDVIDNEEISESDEKSDDDDEEESDDEDEEESDDESDEEPDDESDE